MNIVVLTHSRRVGWQVKRMLRKGGADKVAIVDSVTEAIAAQHRHHASCLFFDRDFTLDYGTFFDRFDDDALLFVTMQHVRDDHDAIAAINTHRVVYYLVYPLSLENIKAALSCIDYWRSGQRILNECICAGEQKCRASL